MVTALLVALAGCGSNAGESSRADRCTDRLLAGVESTRAARRYVRNTYCELFASRGWVYEDGALSVDAQRWLVEGGSEECESETDTIETLQAVIPETGKEGASEALEHLLEHLILRKQGQVDFLTRALRG